MPRRDENKRIAFLRTLSTEDLANRRITDMSSEVEKGMIHEAREAMKAKNDERYHKRRVDAAKIGVAQSTANKTITRGLQQAFGNYGFEGGVIGTTLAAGALFGRGARVRAAARMAAEEAAIAGAKTGAAAGKAETAAKAASHVPDHIPTQSVIKTNHVSEAQRAGVAEKSPHMTVARQLDGLENPAIPEVLSAKRFADVRRDAEKVLSKKSIQLPGRGKVQGLAKVSEKYTENTAPELLPEATDAISESFFGIDNDLYRTDMIFQASDAFTRHRFGKDISSPEAIMFRYELTRNALAKTDGLREFVRAEKLANKKVKNAVKELRPIQAAKRVRKTKSDNPSKDVKEAIDEIIKEEKIVPKKVQRVLKKTTNKEK